ncbi:MAG: MerR family transcriptional regulator [Candidatus Cellulosilyticum pullistercoris]|uniref:MerR family transcriptional regulator n=1 Tax=Candidatus Cellulosilyticum pullistercoris TaxID=2838521 RepID=A0A9E2KAQ5_9FIRM|nr:MerR family transcriptional regulator [Candidatus Cellulosilyticum pullistercoris]
MDIRVCRNCRKMFQYITGPELCLQCKEAEEEMFQKVKTYLREHPGANMYEINQETGVSVKLIEKFLHDGRLEVSSHSPIVLTCERCGKQITTGRFCSDCKKEVSNEINKVKRMLVSPEKNESDSRPKMRYLESDKIK